MLYDAVHNIKMFKVQVNSEEEEVPLSQIKVIVKIVYFRCLTLDT